VCGQTKAGSSLWRCESCSFDNTTSRGTCEMCDTPRPGAAVAPPPSRPAASSPACSCAASQEGLRSRTYDEIRLGEEMEAQIAMNEIVAFHRATGEAFVDAEFPPTDRSLFDPQKPPPWTCSHCNCSSNPPTTNTCQRCDTQWLRASQWLRSVSIKLDTNKSWSRWAGGADRSPWVVFRGEPDPCDIKQGALGDCWLMSAISVLASAHPKLVKDIFVTKEWNAAGVYQLRLCIDGAWQTVTLDDVFPCNQQGFLAYSQAARTIGVRIRGVRARVRLGSGLLRAPWQTPRPPPGCPCRYSYRSHVDAPTSVVVGSSSGSR